jgi:hypothetical protein
LNDFCAKSIVPKACSWPPDVSRTTIQVMHALAHAALIEGIESLPGVGRGGSVAVANLFERRFSDVTIRATGLEYLDTHTHWC